MSDFKVKMHQNRFHLGFCPRPHCGSLQRSPRPLSWNKGALLLREREGKGREGKGWEEGEGEGKRREGKGKGGREGKEKGRKREKGGERGHSPYQS